MNIALDKSLGLSPQNLRRAFSHYPTGVSVVTAKTIDDTPLALVIGTFTAVSLEPALIGFLPMQASRTWQNMATCKDFVINILAHDQEALCRHMAAPSLNRFDQISYRLSDKGIPLLDNVLMHLECRLHSIAPAGDHWFILCEVTDVSLSRDCPALIFNRGQYGMFSGLAS